MCWKAANVWRCGCIFSVRGYHYNYDVSHCRGIGGWSSCRSFNVYRSLGDAKRKRTLCEARAILSNLTNAERMKSGTLLGSIDGGMCDNTGIVHAVAVGATEVVVVEALNDRAAGKLSIQASTMLFSLFANPDKTESALGRLYADVPYSNEKFCIFEEQACDIEAQYNTLPTLKPLRDKPWTTLVQLRVGSLQATTVSEQYFNIKAGRRVIVHVIGIEANVTIAALNDLTSYGTLLQEIVEAFVAPENEEIVRSQVLGPMILGIF
eukprot:TRINITY_DN14802_c0_g1_i1.p1 TRINITY_DN14802_c0_g1~~TRINITY_DN14802_c0_g1_i1.p1  ORF type:complete len:265 (-),score=24.90 TRINITY_DN14802_c0_g1_i1:98-892(-)